MQEFTGHELKIILKSVMKTLPEGPAKGDLLIKIVKYQNKLSVRNLRKSLKMEFTNEQAYRQRRGISWGNGR